MNRLLIILTLMIGAAELQGREQDSVRVRVPDTLAAVTALDREDTLSLAVPSNVIVVDTLTTKLASPRKTRLSLDTIGISALRSIDVFALAGPVYNTVNMKGLPTIPSCCPQYTSTWGIEYGVGARYTWTKDEQLIWGISTSLNVQSTGFSKSEPTTILDQGIPVDASFQHALTTAFTMLRVDAGFSYNIDSKFFFGAYLGVDATVASEYTQSETLSSPQGAARYLDNGSTSRNNYAGVIPDLNIVRPHIEVQAGMRLITSEMSSTVIRPTLSYVLRPFSPVAGLSWATHSIAVGASVSIAVEEQYKAILVLDSTASVLEARSRNIAPLTPIFTNLPSNGVRPIHNLNYVHVPIERVIVYENGSVDLPAAYKVGREWRNTRKNPDDSVQIAVIGERLREDPSQQLELLIASRHDPDAQQIAEHHKRANAIVEYLISEWGVAKQQIVIVDEAVITTSDDERMSGVALRSNSPHLLSDVAVHDAHTTYKPDTLTIATLLAPGSIVSSVTAHRSDNGSAASATLKYRQQGDDLDIWLPIAASHDTVNTPKSMSHDIDLRHLGGATKTMHSEVKVDTVADTIVTHLIPMMVSNDEPHAIHDNVTSEIRRIMDRRLSGSTVVATLHMTNSITSSMANAIREQIADMIDANKDDVLLSYVTQSDMKTRYPYKPTSSYQVLLTIKTIQ